MGIFHRRHGMACGCTRHILRVEAELGNTRFDIVRRAVYSAELWGHQFLDKGIGEDGPVCGNDNSAGDNEYSQPPRIPAAGGSGPLLFQRGKIN